MPVVYKIPPLPCMPPLDNPNLREMRELLQEMKAMNDEGLHGDYDLDHLGANPFTWAMDKWNESKQKSKNQTDAWATALTLWNSLELTKKKSMLITVLRQHTDDGWSATQSLLTPEKYQTTKDATARMAELTTIINDRTDTNIDALVTLLIAKTAIKIALQAAIYLQSPTKN